MSAKSRPSDAPNATRQMLDELDALMERMLSLPVNDLEQAGPILAKPADRPALSATLTMVEPAAPPAPRPEEPPRASGKILVGRLTPPSYTAPLDEHAPPMSAPPPFSENLPPVQETWQPASAPAPVLQSPLASSKPARLGRSLSSRLIEPLLWINRRYDRFTERIGLPGRWLRSAQGRTVLGYLGLTLLGVAIAWSLRDGLGWWW